MNTKYIYHIHPHSPFPYVQPRVHTFVHIVDITLFVTLFALLNS
jgi:hypothetical protein